MTLPVGAILFQKNRVSFLGFNYFRFYFVMLKVAFISDGNGAGLL